MFDKVLGDEKEFEGLRISLSVSSDADMFCVTVRPKKPGEWDAAKKQAKIFAGRIKEGMVTALRSNKMGEIELTAVENDQDKYTKFCRFLIYIKGDPLGRNRYHLSVGGMAVADRERRVTGGFDQAFVDAMTTTLERQAAKRDQSETKSLKAEREQQRKAEQEQQRAERELRKAERERQRTERERQRTERERKKAEEKQRREERERQKTEEEQRKAEEKQLRDEEEQRRAAEVQQLQNDIATLEQQLNVRTWRAMLSAKGEGKSR